MKRLDAMINERDYHLLHDGAAPADPPVAGGGRARRREGAGKIGH